MVKRTQTICWLLPTNCLSVSDRFVGLALKVLRTIQKNLLHFVSNLQDITLQLYSKETATHVVFCESSQNILEQLFAKHLQATAFTYQKNKPPTTAFSNIA